MEEWRIVKRNSRYEVSNLGRVRRASNGHIKVPEINSNGYPSVRLSYGKPATGTHYNIHRLVAEAFLPNPNEYPCVNHIDGDKTNNKIENLEWCTYSRNNKHAYDTGLKKPYQQRISSDDMREIERLSAEGMLVKHIAEKYGVIESAIYNLEYRGKLKLTKRRKRRRKAERDLFLS